MAVVLTVLLFAGAALVLLLAWILYPLAKAPSETPFSSRCVNLISYYFLPAPHGLCSWLSSLTGYSKYVISRELFSYPMRDYSFPTVKKRDLKIAGIPVRLYRPIDVPDIDKLPVIVYFHGGGYATCSIDSHNPMCLKICDVSKMAVVAVEYRLAPEHVFPAAFDDCLAVVTALADDDDGYSDELGIDPSAISVAGDSAGGGLSAAVALKWRTMGRRNLRAQVLFYPYLQVLSYKLPSYISEERGSGFLNTEMMLLYASLYVAGNTELQKDIELRSPTLLPPDTWSLVDRRLNGESVDMDLPPSDIYPHAGSLLSELSSPLLAKSVAGVAPALIAVAEHDVLRSEGELYAEKLKAGGVDVLFLPYAHELHDFHAGVSVPNANFFDRLGYNKNADDLTEKMSSFIKAHLD